MGANLLYYRPWRGHFRPVGLSIWPIARVALRTLFGRKLFWVFYAWGLLIFLMFFFGQFLLDWALTQIPSAPLQGSARNRLSIEFLRGLSFLNGGRDTYRYFFAYQGSMLMAMLALAGSVLVGNDFVFGSVPFYLAKPVSPWHYVLGKCLAVGVIINLMTTVPALLLFLQYGFGNWDYFFDGDYFGPEGGPSGLSLLLGILGYGLVLTVFLSVILVATASWMRRTMPMIMVWTALFLFLPLVASVFVIILQYDERWRLLDIWNNLCLMGNACLGSDLGYRRGPQPELAEVVLVMGVVLILCLTYLNRQTRAVEIVR
jgi:hypothetical protein